MTSIEAPSLSPSIPEVAQKLIEHDPQSRVVGSLGRYGVMGVALPELRKDGSRRDIDYFTITPGNAALPVVQAIDGVTLDGSFNKWIRTESGSTHLVLPEQESMHVEVRYPEEVFAPYVVENEGYTVTTLHPEVQRKIHNLKGVHRPKDRVAAATYEAYLAAHPSKALFPEDLLEPFDIFGEMLDKNTRYKIRSKLRNGYHRVAPPSVRRKLRLSRFI